MKALRDALIIDYDGSNRFIPAPDVCGRVADLFRLDRCRWMLRKEEEGGGRGRRKDHDVSEAGQW